MQNKMGFDKSLCSMVTKLVIKWIRNLFLYFYLVQIENSIAKKNQNTTNTGMDTDCFVGVKEKHLKALIQSLKATRLAMTTYWHQTKAHSHYTVCNI